MYIGLQDLGMLVYSDYLCTQASNACINYYSLPHSNAWHPSVLRSAGAAFKDIDHQRIHARTGTWHKRTQCYAISCQTNDRYTIHSLCYHEDVYHPMYLHRLRLLNQMQRATVACLEYIIYSLKIHILNNTHTAWVVINTVRSDESDTHGSIFEFESRNTSIQHRTHRQQ